MWNSKIFSKLKQKLFLKFKKISSSDEHLEWIDNLQLLFLIYCNYKLRMNFSRGLRCLGSLEMTYINKFTSVGTRVSDKIFHDVSTIVDHINTCGYPGPLKSQAHYIQHHELVT